MADTSKPLCLDLFCGRGGWAKGFLDAGYRVVGVDILDMRKYYPGEFIQADIVGWHWTGERPRVIVASPPCTEFSQLAPVREKVHGIKADPEKGLKLVAEAMRIIGELRPDHWALENVKGAKRYILRRPTAEIDAWVLWGTFPGFLREKSNKIWKTGFRPGKGYKKAHPSCHTSRMDHGPSYLRSITPYPIARGLAEACLP